MAYRICSICEAACGLEIDLDERRVVAIRGNDEDVFSTGHVCAKGIALAELDADPDRLRVPLIREGDDFKEASWREAWSLINERLNGLVRDFGRDAVALYAGNPTAHNVGSSFSFGTFAASLGSKNLFTAGTVDQVPKQLACELMFGNDMAVPVPDILHCDYLLMLGANPLVSNGSLWVVPKVRDKIRALQKRGGKLVVVDPRRTETARVADAHLAVNPGSDAWLLAALFNVLRERDCQPPADYKMRGFDMLADALQSISLQDAALHTGLPATAIEQLAQALVDAERPVVYGRIGTTLQAFGTLSSFLIDAVNVLLGALDRRGGAMFPDQPFYGGPAGAQPRKHNRYQSRVSHYPEVLGQMPVVAMAEEMTSPGEGQIRGLVCFAGNPVVSNPDSARLQDAIAGLDFMVCVDLYHNETTQLADVILPGTSPFEDSHYDSFLGSMGYKNAARYSPPLFTADAPDEWTIGLTLSYIASRGAVPDAAELRDFEDGVVAAASARYAGDADSGIFERDVQEIMALIGPSQGVERLLDLGIRAGRWGDHFGRREGLTLAQMADTPNGIDLGDIQAGRLDEVVRHSGGVIELAPDLVLSEIKRLKAHPRQSGLKLIGRRGTRSNNSWLRNLKSLGKGKDLCALQIHPQDAEALDVADGGRVQVKTQTGEIIAVAELSSALMPGVVCLPHGFSESGGLRQSQLMKGPNYNVLSPLNQLDVPSSTPALNGIVVEIEPL